MTTETLLEVQDYPVIDFTGQCGQNSYATSDVGLAPLQRMSINGNVDMHKCVIANDGACVYGVTLMSSPGVYDYVVQVDAQGPSGVFSGGMHLAFEDASGDVYKLYVYSSSRSVHTVRYNSKLPNIKKFSWNT